MVEKEQVKIKDVDNETFEMIAQELQVIKQKDIDGDGKLAVIPKEQMKRIIGRSPDYGDCLMFRMYYELGNKFNDSFANFY